MNMQHAVLIVVLAFAGLDYSTALVSAREGGGPINASPNDSASSGTDAHVQPSGSGVEPPTSLPAPESVTAVCQCQGYKRDVCKCLKAGVKCHCTQTSGSVWELSGGQWIKTGAKADPRRETSQPPSQDPVAVGYPVSVNGDRASWTDGTGKQWYTEAAHLAENMTFANHFQYRGGAMHEHAPKMAVEIKPSGHWERRCFGGYCRMIWVQD